MEFIPQTKATDYNKVSVNDSDIVFVSQKYDGVYLQIHKNGDIVEIFLSSGRRIGSESIESLIRKTVKDHSIVFECEYVIDNDRGKADADIKKISKDIKYKHKGALIVFDIILDTEFVIQKAICSGRTVNKKDGSVALNIHISGHGDIAEATYREMTIREVVSMGIPKHIEGYVLKYPDHKHTGKKTKRALKLKPVYTADLTVTELHSNGWVSLVDENGLTAKIRVNDGVYGFIEVGTIIEIEYESLKKTYNQARYKDIRFDKMEKI